mgnify:CR=1 FL=1
MEIGTQVDQMASAKWFRSEDESVAQATERLNGLTPAQLDTVWMSYRQMCKEREAYRVKQHRIANKMFNLVKHKLKWV